MVHCRHGNGAEGNETVSHDMIFQQGNKNNYLHVRGQPLVRLPPIQFWLAAGQTVTTSCNAAHVGVEQAPDTSVISFTPAVRKQEK